MDPPTTPVYHAVVEKPTPALTYVAIGSRILIQRSSGISREDPGVQMSPSLGQLTVRTYLINGCRGVSDNSRKVMSDDFSSFETNSIRACGSLSYPDSI